MAIFILTVTNYCDTLNHVLFIPRFPIGCPLILYKFSNGNLAILYWGQLSRVTPCIYGASYYFHTHPVASRLKRRTQVLEWIAFGIYIMCLSHKEKRIESYYYFIFDKVYKYVFSIKSQSDCNAWSIAQTYNLCNDFSRQPSLRM